MTLRGTRRQWALWSVILLGLSVLFGLGSFLAGQHLEKAAQWSEVVGLFLTIAGLSLSIIEALRKRSTPAQPRVIKAGEVKNEAIEPDIDGPLVMIRDARLVDLGDSPTSSAARGSGMAGRRTGRDPGDVHNRIEGGSVKGPTIMGRDLDELGLRSNIIPPAAVPGRSTSPVKPPE